MSEGSVNARKSEAMKIFEINLDSLMVILDRLEPERMINVAQAISDDLKQGIASGSDLALLSKDALDKVGTSVQQYLEFHTVAFEWMPVMLVTFLEAYLEEGLIDLATQDSKLLEKAPVIPPSRVFEIDTLEELRGTIRRDWAQSRLRPGGPETWIKLFKNLGVRNYDGGACDGVQHLWNTRNIIVHGRGIASDVYVKKYPFMNVKSGTKIKISSALFLGWLAAVKNFMLPVENLFLNYKRSD
jgi:hypothetical protein